MRQQSRSRSTQCFNPGRRCYSDSSSSGPNARPLGPEKVGGQTHCSAQELVRTHSHHGRRRNDHRALQRQRRERSPASTAPLARSGGTGHRLPSGAQVNPGQVSGACNPRSRLPLRMAWPKELERLCAAEPGRQDPRDAPRLPNDPDPSQSRYIEAAINGVLVGGLYLPNGNPRPGPKFDYKLRGSKPSSTTRRI